MNNFYTNDKDGQQVNVMYKDEPMVVYVDGLPITRGKDYTFNGREISFTNLKFLDMQPNPNWRWWKPWVKKRIEKITAVIYLP